MASSADLPLFELGGFARVLRAPRLHGGTRLADFLQAAGKFGGLCLQRVGPLSQIRLATFQLMLFFGQSTLATGQFVPALVELLHALLEFAQQGFLPLAGVRLPRFPLSLPLVEFFPPTDEFRSFLLELVGLASQVVIAAFGV